MPTSPDTHKTVIYAGQSERRIAFLRSLPLVKVAYHGGMDEPDVPDVKQIVFHKLNQAKEELNGELLLFLWGGHVLVAADARTEVKRIDANSGVIFESQGKPVSVNTVQQNFRSMFLAQKHDGTDEASYRVRVASISETVGNQAVGVQLIGVVFKPHALEFLASEIGFKAYLDAYDYFYRRPPYSSYGLRPIDPTKISAGLSLPVLVSMGLVEALELDDNKCDISKKTLSQAIFAVAVGFAPNVIESIHPDAMSYVMQWPWLVKVVSNVLNSNKD